MKPLNRVVAATPPSGIRRFFDLASQMEGVISLGVGEPDFVTPWRIREAAIYAIEKGLTSYTANAGLIELRELIAERLSGRHGVCYHPNEVIVTVGVSEALDLALRAILNPGDEVLYVEPSYVSYSPCIAFAGGVPVPVPGSVKDLFRATPETIESSITPKTKAILLCYPNNPTGATQTRANLQAIVDLAVRHDLYLVSDEIYDRLTYVGEHTCVASLNRAQDRTVLLNGFSKSYAMTGWRVAYACAPRDIAESMLKIHQYSMLCAPHVSQAAAIEALRNAEADVQSMLADYDRRRRLFVRGLNSAGLDCIEPSGAFYAFPSIRRTGFTSEEFAERLLQEERVAVVPGTAFGPSGEGFVRCSYATSLANLEEALRRLCRFMERHTKPARQPAKTSREAVAV